MEYEIFSDFKNDYGQQAVMDEEFKKIKQDRDFIRKEVFKPAKDITVYLAINISRLIHQAKQLFDIKPNNRSNIKPYQVPDEINELIQGICLLENKNNNSIYEEANKNARMLL